MLPTLTGSIGSHQPSYFISSLPLQPTPPPRQILSVSQLNSLARELLEEAFPLIWVEGEISNLSRPSSGHLYFTLKDERAQVRCALFRTRGRYLGFNPAEGDKVLARARLSLYEARGDYQLIVESLEPAGDGALRRAFELLKQKLLAEGLFDTARKRPLPPFVQRVAVITSATGAAIRDILSVLKRRFPAIEVTLLPVAVQGASAAGEIVAAIATANRLADQFDLILLGRGGGSLEDLWPFNEEQVVRAIYHSKLPVVSAVGHETDFTLADLVADLRAPTPSAAAELISPDQEALLAILAAFTARLQTAMRQRLAQQQARLTALERQLRHPGQRLREQAQRVDEFELRLRHGLRQRLRQAESRLLILNARLWRHLPNEQVERHGARLDALRRRLQQAMEQRLGHEQNRLTALLTTLNAVSPLSTLARGYAIVTRAEDGLLLHDAGQVECGQQVIARLHQGALLCRVEGRESIDAEADEP